jgi:hypothetical protein
MAFENQKLNSTGRLLCRSRLKLQLRVENDTGTNANTSGWWITCSRTIRLGDIKVVPMTSEK